MMIDMSNKVSVDMNKVRANAEKIAKTNQSIDTQLSILSREVNRLSKNWKSTAGTKAISKFNKINETYKNPRSTVINQLTGFMNNQVATGYETIEQQISKAAKKFK